MFKVFVTPSHALIHTTVLHANYPFYPLVLPCWCRDVFSGCGFSRTNKWTFCYEKGPVVFSAFSW